MDQTRSTTAKTSVGRVIDRRCAELDIVLADLAQHAKMQPGTLRDLRNGTRRPLAGTLRKVAGVLGWDPVGWYEYAERGEMPPVVANPRLGEAESVVIIPGPPPGTGHRKVVRPDGLVDYWLTTTIGTIPASLTLTGTPAEKSVLEAELDRAMSHIALSLGQR